MPASELVEAAGRRGLLMLPRDGRTVWAVTNLMVSAGQIQQAVAIIRDVVS